MWGYDKMALGQIFEAILGQYRKIPFLKGPPSFFLLLLYVWVQAGAYCGMHVEVERLLEADSLTSNVYFWAQIQGSRLAW